MSDSVSRIAEEVRQAQDPGARLRIGRVTAVDAKLLRAQLDITDTAWVTYDVSLPLISGDRVYAFQQGPTIIIAGKISGASGPPVGSMTAYAGAIATVPNGWRLADGAALSRTEHPVLFDRIGTAYGAGDGSTTFNLPNLVGRFALGSSAARARGSAGGVEDVTLTTGQIPAHTHGSAGAHTHSLRDPVAVASGTGSSVMEDTTGSSLDSGSAGAHTHASVGGGLAHENMPPYVSMHYIIRVI